MPINDMVKRNWIEIQKKHPYPVNAIGVRISAKDERTLRIWREEGIDKFLKK